MCVSFCMCCVCMRDCVWERKFPWVCCIYTCTYTCHLPSKGLAPHGLVYCMGIIIMKSCFLFKECFLIALLCAYKLWFSPKHPLMLLLHWTPKNYIHSTFWENEIRKAWHFLWFLVICNVQQLLLVGCSYRLLVAICQIPNRDFKSLERISLVEKSFEWNICGVSFQKDAAEIGMPLKVVSFQLRFRVTEKNLSDWEILRMKWLWCE